MYKRVVIIIGRNHINKKLGIGSSFKKKQLFNTRSLVLLSIFSLCFVGLLTKIGYIQFVKGSDYKTNAYKQQTKSQTLMSKRGTIYDATNKVLALSSSVDSISINNGQVCYSDGKIVPNDVLADGFSKIFSLNYDELLEKLNSNNSLINIAKKVEKPYIDTLKAWMEENKITTGINIDEDSKRTYPCNDLASNIIGFCGNDNQGLEGIEAEWEEELSGIPGRIVTSTNVNKEAISDDNEQYIPAQNGSDIYLTIDTTVQSYAERYLKQAVIDNKAEDGLVIVMRPYNGDILAIASSSTYNLNEPFSPNTDALRSKWDTLSSEEQSNELIKMWRNRPISDVYDPGSTFKIITSSIGLEENLVKTDTAGDFYCDKYYYVDGQKIACWASSAHHGLSLRGALENSCNPSFIQLGQRIGKERFYKYLKAFNLFGNTGVRLPGEGHGIFHDYDTLINVDLASMSFGQGFSITPLQLITSVSACVNGGDLMQPRIVSKVVNTDTGVETEIAPVKVRQVISKSTSDKIKDMMKSVVTHGTGKNAAVKGYSIGGKSGTSEILGTKDYIASFVAISPTENPEVIVLVVLKKPHGSSHQGGTICAPVASQILSKILPHLGVTSTVTSETSDSSIMIPDVSGKSLTEARKALESYGFTVISRTSSNSDITVVSQYPKAGTPLQSGAVVCIYTDGVEKIQKQVPDLKGKTAGQAKNSLSAVDLNISIEGTGKVISQDILAGTSVAEGTIVTVTLQEEIAGGAQ